MKGGNCPFFQSERVLKRGEPHCALVLCITVMHSGEEGLVMIPSEEVSCRTTVTIPRADHELLVNLADSKHVSVSWMIREAIRTYLDQQTPLFRSVEGKNS